MLRWTLLHGALSLLQGALSLLMQGHMGDAATPEDQVSALQQIKAASNSSARFETWREGIDPCGSADCGPTLPHPAHECNWQGLSCEDWAVVGLNLSRAGPNSEPLYGHLAEDVALLNNLTVLDLSNNKIGGTLPRSWANLSRLRVLDLSMNLLTGVLPRAWSNLASLEVLDLHRNWLAGSLQCSWAGMQSLRVMNLSENALSGQLCAEYAQIDSLETVDLSNNRLDGFIPPVWANLQQLHSLNLQSMCGICGFFPVPAQRQLEVMVEGTHMGTACSLSYCKDTCSGLQCGMSGMIGIFGHIALAIGLGLFLFGVATLRKAVTRRRDAARLGADPAAPNPANRRSVSQGRSDPETTRPTYERTLENQRRLFLGLPTSGEPALDPEGGTEQAAAQNPPPSGPPSLGMPSVIVVQPDDGRALAYIVRPSVEAVAASEEDPHAATTADKPMQGESA